MNNMRRGFTMIELIFVIVIIGILAAVAIPKLAGTATEAKKSLYISFMGTLNRTVGPAMWADNIRNGGSIKNINDIEVFKRDYSEVPDGLIAINFGNAASPGSAAATVATLTKENTGLAEDLTIVAIDGSPTQSPSFGWAAIDANETNTTFPF